jgi:predicted permease
VQILNNLVPIFAVIVLGILLRKRAFLNEESTQAFNRFAYYFALPCLLLYKIGGATSPTGLANRFLVTLFAAAFLTAISGWIVSWFLNVPNRSRGAMIQACFRGNLAFVGLPLMMFIIAGLPDGQRSQIEGAMLVAIVPVVIFYNAGAVAALAIYQDHPNEKFSWSRTTVSILTNPLIVACAVGGIIQANQFELPVPMERTCIIVGAAAFPLALLGIGSQLATISVANQWLLACISTVIKCILCPLIALAIGCSVGLEGLELQLILLMSAMPTAVSSYVLTDQMKGDSDLAASAVVVCTAFSLVSLSVILLLTG